MAITAAQISETYRKVLEETPSPWDDSVFLYLFSRGRLSYRQRLDMRRTNYFGDVIPRIVLVRANLRRLGKPARAPRLPA